MSGLPIFILFAVLVVALMIFGAIAARQRREAMQALAARLGLSFNEERDYGLADQFDFLDTLAHGSNRYAFNILSGSYKDHAVRAFDYHYETHSTDSKGRRRTHHHHLSAFVLTLPRSFPELRVTREGVFSKIAQAFGYDDIDFESAEFSRTFCVRSKDKKFAYDFCHPQTMEYLLAHRDLSIEVERDVLAVVFNGQISPESIEGNLDRLVSLRGLMPDYLFN